MTAHILDQAAPGLANRLRALQSEDRHRVVVRGALFAAQGMCLDAETGVLLEKLRAGGKLSAEEAVSAMALSEGADERYFRLKEEGAPAAVWARSFALARMLRGIGIGFGAAPREDVADAIYEISKSVDDSEKFFERIASEVEAISEGK